MEGDMSSSLPATTEGRFPIAPVSPETDDFPFRRELSLAPLVNVWWNAAESEHGLIASMGRLVREQLRATPELLAPLDDLAFSPERQELVDVLMAKIFPTASWDRDYGAVLAPFAVRAVYGTPSFRQLVPRRVGALADA